MGIPHYRLNQYEADDIIGTLAKQGEAAGYEVVVLSGDKDLIQLADKISQSKLQQRSNRTS